MYSICLHDFKKTLGLIRIAPQGTLWRPHSVRACVCVRVCGAYPESGTSTATAAGNLEETLIAQRQHLTVTARYYRITANTAHALLLYNIYHDVSRLRTTRTKVINIKLFIRTIMIVRRQFTINHTLL